jgi:cbb3-type cytochrome oxidase subunit 3
MTSLLDLLSRYGWFFGVPIVFLVVIAWVFRPGAGRRYRKDAKMPFEDDDPPSA